MEKRIAKNISYINFMTYTGADDDLKNIASKESEIPEFQRNYVWKKNQIDELIDSIRDNDNGYYLGNVVIVKGSNGNGIGKIVDGQQRLITLSLILFVLLDYISDDLLKNKIKNIIWKEHDNINPRIEFKKSELDEAYKNILNNIIPDDLNDIDSSIKKILYKAFSDIRNKIGGLKNKDIFIEKIISLEFVVIRTYSEEEAYLLFEGLNSTGLTLSAVELTKNAILSKIKDLDSVNIKKYVEAWDKFEKKFDSNKANLTWMLKFLRHQWYSIDGYVTTPNLFKKIKEVKIKDSNLESLKSYLELLQTDSDKYIKLRTSSAEKRDFNVSMNKDAWESINNILFETTKLGLDQIYSVYLALWKYGDEYYPRYISDGRQFEDDLKRLWSFIFLIKFSDISPSKYEHLFADFCKDIQAKSYNEFKEIVNNFFKKGLSPIITSINVDEFSERFSNDIYTKDYGSLTNFILLDYLTEFGSGMDITPTIEHIIPKSVFNNWPNINDSLNLDYIENIGNLTLLGEELNQLADNKSFDEKFNIAYKLSAFEKNKFLDADWGSQFKSGNPIDNAIIERGKDIGKFICEKYKKLLSS